MIWTLIALAYLVIAMSVACFGAFGISVDRVDRAKLDSYTRTNVLALSIAIATLTSLFWPIGVPLYFAVRKGHMVADELARRDSA